MIRGRLNTAEAPKRRADDMGGGALVFPFKTILSESVTVLGLDI